MSESSVKGFVSLVLFLAGSMLAAAQTIPAQQQLDLVTKLPRQPNVSFAQYAGYVTVNDTVGRALFYYFVEAKSSPETKPLVLWLNGGPGCSSLGAGAWQELGPFRVQRDGYTLYSNEYSWNGLANILFLESPAGVGYSYSNDTEDYYSAGDTQTSYDSLIFLTRWFDRFPQYKYRDFYIAGESYAGNYVPQLVKRIVDMNKGQANSTMNLKGFLVGNAVIDGVQDFQGKIDYWWSHALISDETYADLKQCLVENSSNTSFRDCEDGILSETAEKGNINPYDIYTPVCLSNESSTNVSTGVASVDSIGYDPCMNFSVTAYLNRPDVTAALHANVTHLGYGWELCSDVVSDYYSDRADSVIPLYEEFLTGRLKIWVVSGDTDSVVPVTSTRYSLQLLNLNTTVPWYAWYLDSQVGGYTQGYGRLTFATVRDAGHQIPLFQPARALALFRSYITGESLPRK